MIWVECEVFKVVVVWDNYGMFSWEDILIMISVYDVKRICGMVKEEEMWFLEFEIFFLDYNSVDKIEEVWIFRDLIWFNDEKDVVLNYGEKGGIRVYDFCIVVCNRWFIDDLFNFFF